MHIVRGVLWAEKVSADSDELIHNEVMQIVSHNAMTTTSLEAIPA